MKFLTFHTELGLQLGVLTERGVLPLRHSINDLFYEENLSDTIQQYENKAVEDGDPSLFLPEEELTLGACVPEPGKIICIGLNYRKHAVESNMPIPEFPILFNKFQNAIAANGEEVELPAASSQVDYEAELAIVIGKTAKNIKPEGALDYVFGYCAANDLSARDLQFRTNQWLLGKTCDGFCPVGPYLVTKDEIENPNNLSIRTLVNGEIRQDSNTADMVFDCRELISYISQFMTLQPGDLILTGTPEGVIMGYPKEQQVWLQDGDEVSVEIEKLGCLTNRLKRYFFHK